MILYNVTVNIDVDVHEEWLGWMREVHIPEVIATGRFIESTMSRVLAEEEGGYTYAIQYLAPDMESYQLYLDQEAEGMRTSFDAKYAGKYVAFRTLLQVVHQHGKG